jgi:hypothetical protein
MTKRIAKTPDAAFQPFFFFRSSVASDLWDSIKWF